MMKNFSKAQQKSPAKGAKKPYRAPVLTDFGSVGELTAGGSGGRTELNPQGKCTSNSPNKQRC